MADLQMLYLKSKTSNLSVLSFTCERSQARAAHPTLSSLHVLHITRNDLAKFGNCGQFTNFAHESSSFRGIFFLVKNILGGKEILPDKVPVATQQFRVAPTPPVCPLTPTFTTRVGATAHTTRSTNQQTGQTAVRGLPRRARI